ncbi:5-oxoprolinase subunit PxpA [Caldibacillus lycopersici]|uniref:5-oxoprolinase subunit A n=1 Tax=Perspicuibacillus lycopersici TaxID=1325689 RepID=A0AAE3IXI7_9BACI|nr:5-oxoprolinase subunit PxpA [Perspicuibacillus lycopersici]MCU9614744.1 5-oxoprolinase subunit PxpA [Perspicuibacillus lycopersici]
MTLSIDINCDLGESFGTYIKGQDAKVMKYITSANIACGYHAGDHNIMYETVKMAVENNIAIGAHPGFQDIIGFGRRELQITPNEVYNLMLYQMGALQSFAQVLGGKLHHVKPHGALYNMAAKDENIAEAIVRAVCDMDAKLILYGLSGSILTRLGRQHGLQVAEEVFADRSYQKDGSLTPRSNPRALIQNDQEVAIRVIRMIREGKVLSLGGEDISIKADSVCIHGDAPTTLAFVKILHTYLEQEDIHIEAIASNKR